MTHERTTKRRYWIGVASHNHVRAAVQGGFCQLGHGKYAPVRALKAGDILLFYSARESMGKGTVLQAFTAAGEILDDTPFEAEQAESFKPFRRETKFFKCQQAFIRPLLDRLSFTKGRAQWGMVFRRSSFSIDQEDFITIAAAMTLETAALVLRVRIPGHVNKSSGGDVNTDSRVM